MERHEVASYFKELQDHICQELEDLDGKGTFLEDAWNREGGGGGRTRVMSQAGLFEKGGVNFSEVHGETPQKLRQALEVTGDQFFATGLSIVLHPLSPMVPIIHMNIRYFEVDDGTNWFGGGIDLTPHYIDPKEAAGFHQHLKAVCDRHHASYYPAFKEWADDYFYIKHREETRGVGGIFFDRLQATDNISIEQRFNFVKDVGEAFIPVYKPIVEKNRYKKYGDREKEWQLIRRGRYVEFNLVYDRGTRFGLDSGGRIESILMSLPEYASWKYNYQPPEGSKEHDTLQWLQKGVDWVKQVNDPSPEAPLNES